MIRKLLVFESIKLRQGLLSYALCSDGVIEKVVINNNRVDFYYEVKSHRLA